MKKNVLFIYLSLLGFYSNAQNTIYVNQNAASGQQTGASWANAFTDLQSALSIAQYGDAIWVAAGAYFPTSTNDRTISFNLKNGVKLLGGFNGTETHVESRDPLTNPTRLSGNIGDSSIVTDNSLHVARGKGLDGNTIIDGLIFSDGYSVGSFDAPSDPYGAGLYLTGSSDLIDSHPVIMNCVFERNQSGEAGGAIYIGYIDLDDPFQSENFINPVVSNCLFVNNKSNMIGGAILKQGPTLANDLFSLSNCRFVNNYALYDGGAVYFRDARNSDITMQKCVFELNKAWGGSGGGFYISPTFPGNFTIALDLESCIFSQNISTEGGGFSYDNRIYEFPNCTLNIKIGNCMFERNETRSTQGPAFFVSHVNHGKINAEIKGCGFVANKATTFFTAAILCADECEANVLIEDCYFLRNKNSMDSTLYCAGFSAGGGKFITTRINNCVFADNGAAIFAGAGEMDIVSTDITNCTFFQNGTEPFGKRWYPSFANQGAQYYNNMNFYNCIIWETMGNPSYIFRNHYPDAISAAGFFVDYCSVQPIVPNVTPNADIVFGDSIFVTVYPNFMDTLALDFRLDKCDFTINKGSNEKAMTANLPQDFGGNPRIRFGRVDLGAFEQQDSCFSSIIVNPVSMQSMLIYPNPSITGELAFALPDFEGNPGRISIYTQDGAVIGQQNIWIDSSNLLHFKSLPSGSYYVLLEIGKFVFVGKWVLAKV